MAAKREVLVVYKAFGTGQARWPDGHPRHGDSFSASPAMVWLTLRPRDPTLTDRDAVAELWRRAAKLEPDERRDLAALYAPHAVLVRNDRRGQSEWVDLGPVESAFGARTRLQAKLSDGGDVLVTKASCLCGGGSAASAAPSPDRCYITGVRTDLPELVGWLVVSPDDRGATR